MRAGCIVPGLDRSPASPNPARWYIHGAAQNRRGTVSAVSHILGAPSFSPHRSRAFTRPVAHSPTRPFAVSLSNPLKISILRFFQRPLAVPVPLSYYSATFNLCVAQDSNKYNLSDSSNLLPRTPINVT